MKISSTNGLIFVSIKQEVFCAYNFNIFIKEFKVTLLKHPESLLTRIVMDKCESPVVTWDGRKIIYINDAGMYII